MSAYIRTLFTVIIKTTECRKVKKKFSHLPSQLPILFSHLLKKVITFTGLYYISGKKFYGVLLHF